MGARPSSFKKSGGFLNGVDGVITGYRFTSEFNGVAFTPGKWQDGSEKIPNLNFELAYRVDGSENDAHTPLRAGNMNAFDVSEDGLTITPIQDGYELSANTAFARFVQTLVAPTGGGDGFPEDRLPEDVFNYETIIGTRVRFAQEPVLDRKTGKPTVRKVTKGTHAGKEFPNTTTVIETVYTLPVASAKKAVAGKPAAAKGAKVAAVSVEDLAIATQLGILEANGGTIEKKKLTTRVIIALKDDPNQGAVRKMVATDEFQALEAGWSYDATTGVIELAA